jgi:8-oxo-dGTP pyrophosphatase MutT (NUDIX family)
MKNRLSQEIEEILDNAFSEEVALKFREKLQAGKLTRDEDPETHFCAYFAACDYDKKQVFIGHHIKSGLWLFNGGHVDKGESLLETVKREIYEEWGLNIDNLDVSAPALLTIAEINNPTKQTCKLHLDIWRFVNVDKEKFKPDPLKLAEEFHCVEWMDLAKARQTILDEGTLQALDFIESNYFNK